MAATRELENVSGSTKTITEIGQDILDGEVFLIPPEHYGYYANKPSLEALLDAGSLVFKLNGLSLAASIAKCVINEISPFIEIDNAGVLLKVAVQRISLIGDLAGVVKDDKTVEIEGGIGAGAAQQLISVKCLDNEPDCIINAALLIDHTLCGIKRGVC